MRWNAEAGECQIYLDVDCSRITYDTAPSSGVLAAVDRANTALAMTMMQDIPINAEAEELGK